MKIKTLSPVHVGTGNRIGCICYSETNQRSIVNCYDTEDVVISIPSSMYLDESYLRMLKSAKADNESVNSRLLNEIRYDSLKPKYQAYINGNLNYQETDEQVKTLNKPYVPGSSIKGTIMHALLYRTIKENYRSCAIEEYIDLILDKGRTNRVTTESLYGHVLKSRDAYKIIAGFLLCEDLYFEKIGMYKRCRINTGKENRDMPLPNCEAILPGQTAEQALFQLADDRIRLYLNSGLEINERIRKFLGQLNKPFILESLGLLGKENIRIESEYDYSNTTIPGFLNEIRSISDHSIVVRIGGYTNYWEKSISYLVKINNPQYYKYNFAQVFAPKRDKSRPESMPKTRVILYDDLSDYLAGYLEISDEQ